jgi:hypothetical protein
MCRRIPNRVQYAHSLHRINADSQLRLLVQGPKTSRDLTIVRNPVMLAVFKKDMVLRKLRGTRRLACNVRYARLLRFHRRTQKR